MGMGSREAAQAAPSSVGKIARLLDQIVMPGIKAEAGPGCCVYASIFAAEVLSQLGVSASIVPVCALVYPEQFEGAIDRPSLENTARDQLQRHFPVFGLGWFNDYVQPIPGGSKLPGFTTAAHVVVSTDPCTLIDFTLDQLNSHPEAPRVGLHLPSRLIRRLRSGLPTPRQSIEAVAGPGWIVRYIPVPEDLGALPLGLRPQPRHVRPIVDQIRLQL